jgi:hypothetical protein
MPPGKILKKFVAACRIRRREVDACLRADETSATRRQERAMRYMMIVKASDDSEALLRERAAAQKTHNKHVTGPQ